MHPPDLSILLGSHFGLTDQDSLRFEKIEKGGSDREFHRLWLKGEGQSFILVTYGTARPENARYADIAEFLFARGVAVPEVQCHEPGHGVLVMEDLGVADLWSFRGQPWSERRPLYEDTLRQAHVLHGIGVDAAERAGLVLEPPFDETLYRWEQRYFFDHCLGKALAAQVSASRVAALAALPVWELIARELAARPRVLVHRDFQSHNILIHKGRVGVIDFQGMRAGLAQYDLASLLYDPYVTLSASERGELLGFYRDLDHKADDGRDEAEFLRAFRLCSVQRLIQALGAYGFLGLTQGKPAFLSHIPAALSNLREVVALLPELAEFGELLAPLNAQSATALEQ
jgi:aminoglycoside/choline kinase family phosphotransferase